MAEVACLDGREETHMADTPKTTQTPPVPESETPKPIWLGTGLCCEAQGDGVPCQGIDGECEHCGRALPIPDSAK